MKIEPRIRRFICLTAHPEGCTQNVREQIGFVKSARAIAKGPRNALIVGGSTGYGLATRIVSTFACRSGTVGVYMARPSRRGRTADASWYNSVAFERLAHREGLYAKSVIGDAFSEEIKEKTVAMIKDDLGFIDLFIYSLAAPRRTHPKTGEVFKLALKPVGGPFASKGLDTDRKQIREVAVEAATEEEIRGSMGVMGGDDWEMWVQALLEAGVLAKGCTTVAYSYIGPRVTWPIYRHGTIGLAKEDLEESARKINRILNGSGQAYISVNKGVVSQASSAIPVVPLYMSILLKVMRDRGLDEGCVEQIYRLFRDHLFGASGPQLDEKGRIRIDDLELRDDVQQAAEEYWRRINSENIDEMSDFSGYQSEFLRLFGFDLSGVDYDADVDPVVEFDYDLG